LLQQYANYIRLSFSSLLVLTPVIQSTGILYGSKNVQAQHIVTRIKTQLLGMCGFYETLSLKCHITQKW